MRSEPIKRVNRMSVKAGSPVLSISRLQSQR
ncbi:UNVERIFIED_ORG: hypothetical protein J2Y77_001393 [Pseudomonas lini]